MIYKKHKYFNMNITKDSHVKKQNAYFYNCCFDETMQTHEFKDCIFDNCIFDVIRITDSFILDFPYTLLKKTKKQKQAFFSKDMNQCVYVQH